MEKTFREWLDGERGRQLSRLRQDTMRTVQHVLDTPAADEARLPSPRLHHELRKRFA